MAPHQHPQVLSLGFLHKEVREKGGAYGGGASSSPLGGTFTFSSYRDPRQVCCMPSPPYV